MDTYQCDTQTRLEARTTVVAAQRQQHADASDGAFSPILQPVFFPRAMTYLDPVLPLRVDQHIRLCPMPTGSPHGDPTAQQSVRLFLLFLFLVLLAVLQPCALTNLDPIIHVCHHPDKGASQALCWLHVVSSMSLAKGATMMSGICKTACALCQHTCSCGCTIAPRRKDDSGCSQTIHSQQFRNGGSACCPSLSYIQCWSHAR